MVDMLMCEAAEVVVDDLGSQINKAWQDLADAVFNPSIIIYSFEEMVKNPLVLAVCSALLVVSGFVLFARAISIFNIKH